MKAPLARLLAVSLLLAVALPGCSRIAESRLNPFNWFGSSQAEPVSLTPEGGYQEPGDARIAAAQITALETRKVSGGAIVLATGLPPTMGWWDAELVPQGEVDKNGTLTYRLVMAEPPRDSRDARRTGAPFAREIVASVFLSEVRLANIRKIVVEGNGNARSVSR